MSQRDPVSALLDMLAYAEEAVALTDGRSRAALSTDRSFELALRKLLEIVGEAAAQVPPDIRERHPELNWQQAVAMRNRLIHAYFSVDLDILWFTANLSLPAFVAQLRAIIEQETA